MDLEEVQVASYLRSHPDFLQQWLERNADRGLLEEVQRKWAKDHESEISSLKKALELSSLNVTTGDDEDDTLECEPSPSMIPRTGRKSVTSDLFHQWLASGSSGSNRSGSLLSAPPSSNVLASASPAPEDDSHDKGDMELLAQNDKLMDLILDISNELDINVLCHKILVNVCRLTKADRSSLFLARGPRGKRYLEAKLFDVKVDTSLEEAMGRANKESISIPFGVGICGHVAETKETIHIKDAYEDHRFNREIDVQTGYTTHSLVSMPVCNFDGEVIGVAQIMNKTGQEDCFEFSETDLKVFQRYLTFCGIGIQNAQLFEVSILEYKKNKLLLSLAKSLFEEQMSLERLVSTIIIEAKSLLKCDRCTVYLLDLRMYDAIEDANFFVNATVAAASGAACKSPSSVNSGSGHGATATSAPVVGGQMEPAEFVFPPTTPLITEDSQSNCSAGSTIAKDAPGPGLTALSECTNIKFQRVWESESSKVKVYGPQDENLLQSRRARIAKYVATSAEVLNLSSVANWLGENLEDKDGFVPKTMLCLPIFNGQRDVIGVAQLINKNNGSTFNESDIALFEAFAIFCGIGIHNTKMYEGAIKMMAKQKVALDCLSYHASATLDDTDELSKAVIPSADKYSLYSYKFNDMILSDDDTYKATIRMFLEFGLVNQFHIPYQVLCRWVLSVKKNYRPVSYHNWRHALNVCQTMFTVLRTGKMDRFMDDLEIFGLLVACLCHDLDHRGTNNAFQSKVESPLAILYSTSTMEHHHFDQCVMILSSEGNNIFQGLNTEDYRKVMKVVEQAILSTDLALYFRKKDRFLETANTGEIDWQEQEKKELLCGMLMTACDVSAIAKPWEQQHLLAKRVADEFFDQGDLEKLRLNTQPIAMMDRDRKDELPQMQVEFIDVVCKPLYTSLSESFPWIKPLLDGCLSNREKWSDLAEKVEMGLTWIDHDTIEKPIEEIHLGTDEAVDIEFTVETLKSTTTTSSLDKKNMIGKKRSFRASNKSNKGQGGHGVANHGGSFFHRRLSSKSPHRDRGHHHNLTGEILVDTKDNSSAASIEDSESSSSNNVLLSKVIRSRSASGTEPPGSPALSPPAAPCASSTPAHSPVKSKLTSRLRNSHSVEEKSESDLDHHHHHSGLLRRTRNKVVNAFK